MSIFEAIILGLVEGITEFLPISSTAHLMMTSKILDVSQSEFTKSFEIVIQLGAILAVLFIFAKRLFKNPSIWKKIAIAFVPTAIIGLVSYPLIKTHLIGNFGVAVWSLVIGGLALIVIERFISKRANRLTFGVEEITNKQAFLIGVVQALAVIPGVSRAAATIVPAMLFGAGRKAAAEFSFLLAIPTVGAAAGYDFVRNIDTLNGNSSVLLIGFIASFAAALFGIKFLLSFIQNHSFVSFGIYRIAVAFLFLTFFL